MAELKWMDNQIRMAGASGVYTVDKVCQQLHCAFCFELSSQTTCGAGVPSALSHQYGRTQNDGGVLEAFLRSRQRRP